MSQVNEVKKVALFKSTGDKPSFISESTEYMNQEYIRTSEELELVFPPLPKDIQITTELKYIDKEVEELKAKTIRRIEELEQRKQELLAIGFDGESK